MYYSTGARLWDESMLRIVEEPCVLGMAFALL